MKSLDKLRNKVEVVDPAAIDSEELSELLVKAVDNHLDKRNTTDFKRVDGFHPSYTNQCARYWVYLFRGIESVTDFAPQTYRIFDNGHAVHDRIYSYLSGMGILKHEEIPVTLDDPPIRGTADGVIEFHGDKLIELKSISDAGFSYRKIYDKPKDDHIRQAQIYLHCLNLDSGFVIYENKNNQELLPIYIEKDEPFIDKLFTKYRKIYNAFLNDELPVRPYKSIASKQCASCNVREFCWSDEDAGKKI